MKPICKGKIIENKYFVAESMEAKNPQILKVFLQTHLIVLICFSGFVMDRKTKTVRKKLRYTIVNYEILMLNHVNLSVHDIVFMKSY